MVLIVELMKMIMVMRNMKMSSFNQLFSRILTLIKSITLHKIAITTMMR